MTSYVILTDFTVRVIDNLISLLPFEFQIVSLNP